MRLYITPFAFATLMCCGCGSQTSSPNDPQELERLKGTWQVIAVEAAGRTVPPESLKVLNVQYIFDGAKITVRRPGRPDESFTFSVDSGASPKKMTIERSPPTRAIYDLDGARLRLCIMVDENPDAGFPTEMASRPSPKTDLVTLERRAAGTEQPATVGAGGSVYVYTQSTGKLTLNDQPLCVGYSGKGAARNDPAKQAEKDGPIPIGEYMLTGFREEPKLGGKIMGLLPVAGTNYFKRFPGEPFAIIADTGNPPSGCLIVVPRDVLEKLNAFNSRVRVVK
jgi:uncharacterized protein (TIGR03067 family)